MSDVILHKDLAGDDLHASKIDPTTNTELTPASLAILDSRYLTHNHDDRYFTEAEVTTLLAGKSDTGHTHDDRYYTEAEVTTLLAGKSDTGHNHSGVYEPANANIQSHIASTSNPHSVTKSQVGLGSVDNTPDANKPISTATQAALDGKQSLDSDLTAIAGLSPTNDDIIQRKAGAWTNRTMAQLKTDLALTKSDVGLSNVPNTDATARANHTGTQLASTISDFSSAADARVAAAAGVSVASLSGGKIPTSQLPALALTDVFVVASQAAQLALTAEEGDVAIRTDQNKSYVHNGGTAGTMADWSELLTPTDQVLSVNGQTGAVSLTTTHIGEGTNLFYTDARVQTFGDGRYSLTTHNHDASYAPLSHSHAIADVTGLQTALDGKQDALGYTPLNAASNLSDLANAATARTNLGVQAKVFYTVGNSNADYITDGTADDVQIQQAIDAAEAAGGGVVRVKAGTTYTISSPIVAKSNIIYDFRGATIVLAPGSDCNMFVDEDHANNAGSMENITLIGGVWNRGANAGTNNDLHSIILGGENIVVRDLIGASTAGKYLILIQNATNFLVENIYCDTVDSDGVHIQGPASSGVVRNIRGTAGDDLVAITPIDFAAYVWGDEGDVSNILIENIFPVACQTNAVKVLSGKSGSTVLNTKNITIRNVKGSMATGFVNAIYLGDDAGSANTQNGQIDNIIIDDVNVTYSGTNITIQIYGSTTSLVIPSVKISNVHSTNNCTNLLGISGKVNSLQLRGFTWSMTATPNSVITTNSNNSVRIDELFIDDFYIVNTGTTGGGIVRFTNSNLTLKDMFIRNVYTSKLDNLVDTIQSVSLYLNNIDLASNGKVLNVRSPAAVVVEGCSGLKASNTSSSVTSTGTLELKSYNFPMDVGNAQLIKNTGNMAYNTNAARSCGVGPVGYNGTAWYNSLSGATF